MSYASAVEHLYALGQELAVPPGATRLRRFDLAHMRLLVEALGHPEQHFPAILIAGTNGKGSTAATLASILAHAGYGTGLYTSPHLVHINERIQVSPQTARNQAGVAAEAQLRPIADDDFARLFARVDAAGQDLVADGRLPMKPSFFETLTALAFLYFAEQKIDLAVLEVGLGGRLDATNVVAPLLSIITDIALDHQEYLGTTVAEIAREKAGILRPNGTLITLPQHPEANQALGEVASELPEMRAISAADLLPGRASSAERREGLPRNRYTVSDGADLLQIDSPLNGQHQQRNLALAIAAALELRNRHGYKISSAAIETGVCRTVWPGRLELIEPKFLLDVAHNPAGAWTLRAALSKLPESDPRTLIFSCLRDKDLREMAQILLPLFDGNVPGRSGDHILLAPVASSRGADLGSLLAAASDLGIAAHVAPHVEAALGQARSLTPPGGWIVATGSVYLVGELRAMLLRERP